MPNYGRQRDAASGTSVNVLFQKVATATVQKATGIIPATSAEIAFLGDILSSSPIVQYHPAALTN